MQQLHLNQLKKQTAVPTPATCDAYAEAAAVCLEEQKHNTNVILNIEGDVSQNISLHWTPTNHHIKANWNDLQEATEYGATCLALLIIHQFTPYKTIKRSRKRTGFDYWLGLKETDNPLQDKARLEISGILKGTKGQVNQRIREKKKQVEKSDHLNLKAYIIVIEFSKPIAKVIIK